MKSCMFVLKKELYSSLCESAIYVTFQNNCTLNKTNLAKKEDNFYEKYHLLFLWKSSIVKSELSLICSVKFHMEQRDTSRH